MEGNKKIPTLIDDSIRASSSFVIYSTSRDTFLIILEPVTMFRFTDLKYLEE